MKRVIQVIEVALALVIGFGIGWYFPNSPDWISWILAFGVVGVGEILQRMFITKDSEKSSLPTNLTER